MNKGFIPYTKEFGTNDIPEDPFSYFIMRFMWRVHELSHKDKYIYIIFSQVAIRYNKLPISD